MITFFRRALPLLDRGARRRVWVAAALMMVLAAMEAMALLLIAPLMAILTAAGMSSNSRLVVDLDHLLGNPPGSRLALELGVATIILYVVKSVAAVVILRWAMGFSLNEEAKLVRQLMNSYLRTPYREHLRVNSSEKVRTITVAIRNIFQNGFTAGFSAMGDSFSVVLVAVILLVSNPFVALAAGAYFGLVTAVYQRVTTQVLARRVEQLHKDQALDFRTIQQALLAVKEIKIRGLEDVFSDEVYEIRRGLIPAYQSMALLSTTPRYILELAMVGAAATIAAIAYTAESTSAATATLGLFLVGGFRVLAPLNKIIFGNAQAKSAMPGLEQVLADLQKSEETPVPAGTAGTTGTATATLAPATGRLPLPTVALDHVTFSYDPGTPVLEDLSFSVAPGESVGLVGGSGAGKSTLFDVLLGLLRPDRGRVLIGGVPIESVRRQWQDMIGYVPQSSVIFDDSVRANVALGKRVGEVSDDEVWEVLRLAQLAEVVSDLPDGLDTLMGEAGTRLSGGQRQRLGVARALYGRPLVLLFDEATSALDNETEYRLNEVLESLKGSITILVIAHRLSTIRRCDRVLYLEHGRLMAEGDFTELNATIPGFARLVELSSLEV